MNHLDEVDVDVIIFIIIIHRNLMWRCARLFQDLVEVILLELLDDRGDDGDLGFVVHIVKCEAHWHGEFLCDLRPPLLWW